MKKINLTFALLIQAVLTFSQTYTQGCASIEKSNVLDHAKYRITYCLKFKYSNNDKEYNQDTRIVQIGTKVVKDYSDRLLHYDTLATSNFKMGRPTPHLSDAVFPYEIINHYSSQGTLVNYRMFFQLGTLRYLEQFVKQNWSLTNGTTITILNHKCHKATLTFGKRIYTAWYAPDIPIHYGPYKFEGLPGLIMQIEDSEKKYIWSITNLQNVDEPIYDHIYSGTKKTDSKKASATIKRQFKSTNALLNATGVKRMKVVSGKLVEMTATDEKPIPFEPIELP